MDLCKIILLLPTVRPTLAVSTVQAWYDLSCTRQNIEFKIMIPKNSTMVLPPEINATVFEDRYKSCQGLTLPLYQLTRDICCDKNEDIIISMSDDFFPCQSWDVFLHKQFDSFSGLFVSNDGIQVSSSMSTIPILTYEFFKKINKAIYHPAYYHMYADNELFHNAKELNMLKDIREYDSNVYFKHCHYSSQSKIRSKDSTDAAVDKLYEYDRLAFIDRMKLPIETRLVVDEGVLKNRDLT